MSEAKATQPAPYAVEVKSGQSYWWCACGRSATQPFCDGSHEGTGILPVEYIAQKEGTVWFCGCRRTAGPPLCDGSHAEG